MESVTLDCESETSSSAAVTSFRAGPYEVRIANTQAEVEGAQALRYRVLFEEGSGRPKPEWISLGREFDIWDPHAFHVVVIDSRRSSGDQVVGTLRLVAKNRLPDQVPMYTEKSFDLRRLHQRYGNVLELGRFCVHPDGRAGTILMLIWRYTMQFILDHSFDLMVGCASFKGTEIEQHRAIFSYLYKHNLATEKLQPIPVNPNHVALESILVEQAEWDEAKKSVPTLLRGYLKLGAKISDHAIIDPEFNTVFVCIYVDAGEMVSDHNKLVKTPKHG